MLILTMVKKKKIFLFSVNKSFFAKTDLHVVEVIFNVVSIDLWMFVYILESLNLIYLHS